MSNTPVVKRCDHGIILPHECKDCIDRLMKAVAIVAEGFGDSELSILHAISQRPYGEGSGYMLSAQFAVRTQEKLMAAESALRKYRKCHCPPDVNNWDDCPLCYEADVILNVKQKERHP